MTHKKALEALDPTLKDLRGNGKLFGGALILLSGDFRQTLSVIPRSTPADEFNACLKFAVLWRHIKKLILKTNMRVQLQNDATDLYNVPHCQPAFVILQQLKTNDSKGFPKYLIEFK